MDLLSVSAAIDEFGSNNDPLIRSSHNINNHLRHQRIGIIITSFNNEKTIANAIHSVLSQTRPPDIICVADDCSTDNSVDIINSIAKNHKQVQLIARLKNLGVSANRDLAIRSTFVDLISTLDGDDLYYPDKIERELSALNGATDKVAFSDIVVFGPEENWLFETSPYSLKDKSSILKMMTARSTPVPRDMLFSKELFLNAGGFETEINLYEDWAFKMRLMLTAPDGGWVHSGGKGTIYDRRQPGLSGKEPLEHAYAQLLVLARNKDILHRYPDIIEGGDYAPSPTSLKKERK